jgi:phosphoglycerate dehydrogenase-like enzyme
MQVGSTVAANDAIAGLLFLARAFPQRLAAQREHRWLQLRREKAPADVEGQTVLIVGVGAVGAAVARFAQAMGMKVIGVRRTPRGGEPVDEMHTPEELAALLPRAQWVVPACPHAPQTHHLLDAAALARLPRGAGIVNVVAPGLIDEAALLAALHSGQVGHAYLAGIAADSPLRGLPGVLVSPVGAI